jgi:hypothetical protein
MAGNLSVDDRWRKDAKMAAGKANENQPTSPLRGRCFYSN